MSTAEFSDQATIDAHQSDSARPHTIDSSLTGVWSAMASLKLTVVLLASLIFLVFVGTLAQVQHDVWYVMDEGYFRVWFAWVEWQVLPTLLGVFKPNQIQVDGGFYFPGGLLIGTMMAINLIAAHSLRYKVVARGGRLSAAFALLAAGVAATWLVIARALDSAHQATITPEFAETLWNLLRGGFAGVALGLAYLLTLAWGRLRLPEWFILAGLNAVLLAAAAFLFINPDWRINDAGLRIVWQLLQATAAGGLLMAASWLLFAKRSGVVLLHIGIAILMAHEFYVAKTNVEANMMIAEGETVNWAYDTREMELALIDRSEEGVDHATVVPGKFIERASKADSPSKRVVRHPDLPYDVRVLDYFENTSIAPRDEPAPSTLMLGAGKQLQAVEIDKGSGVLGQLNLPGAHVELLDKQSGDAIGTLLVTAFFDRPIAVKLGPMTRSLPGYPDQSGEQTIDTEMGPLAVALRFKRIYKPYDITLEKFAFDRFAGTEKPKNFSSDVRLVDNENGSEVAFHISMNNPLRYRGETFYQSEFDMWTEAGTVLQVVKNEGWMAPYIGCAVVAVGMLVHFGITLLRFLDRRLREAENDRASEPLASTNRWMTPEFIVPGVVALFIAAVFASTFRSKDVVVDGIPLNEIATLPVLDEGRVKPFDSVARNTLQILCARQEAVVSYEDNKPGAKIQATQWLMDVVSGKEESRDYYVFRIKNLELLDTLKLPRRSGFYRYSVNDLRDTLDKLEPQVDLARKVDEKMRTPFQRDVLDLAMKLNIYSKLTDAYSLPRTMLGDATNQDFELDKAKFNRLRGTTAVRSVPPTTADGQWQTLFEGSLTALIAKVEGRPANPAALSLAMVIRAYQQEDAEAFELSLARFNELVAEYEEELNAPKNAEAVASMKTVEKLDTERISFEAWFNSSSPFYYCSVLYLFALLVSAIAWLVAPQIVGRSAIAIIVVTLVVHTLAIAARVYISDRPPITNLYTTAICIGWFIVLGMLVFESIFKLGIGSFVASAVGFATLLIAHSLGLDEDTFTVMQAVLDTQFWLSTHVITINLGYATTMLAGCLGIVYVMVVQVFPLFDAKQTRQLTAMIYGSLCFAILFSFVGTVLGGLWADDSWGRFWGWDPKENGALMIVLWNAIALHARWGKMVGPRGLAMLAIFGNVITAWSWFGVNQLSQGLHAYAFRDDLAFYLLWFFISQIVLLVLAAIPWDKLSSPPTAAQG